MCLVDQLMGMIWEVTKYVCGYCKEEADYMFNLEENMKSLRENWKKLQDMKADIEAQVEEAENSGEMRRIHQVQGWLQQIQDLQNQKEIDDTIVQGALEIQNKCISDCCPKNYVSSYKLGKNVPKLINEVNKLLTEGKNYCKNDKITSRLPITSVEIPVDETVGLDLMVEKVWESIEEENVGVIGLYGMGGAGKTTLLKRINNEFESRKPKFDVVMWVVVSKEFDINSIMDNIRRKIGIEDYIWNQYNNPEEKATKIYNVLKRKKFVLLLDDIWDQLDLKMVGVPNPKITKLQSKVLFTTRSEDVCYRMRTQRKFKVECLTEKEAFELFCMKVGQETLESHPKIPKLARDMAAKCKGLPLALIVVGSAMAGVKSLEAWEHSKNNLPSSSWVASDLEQVFSILKFSYERLPDEIYKNCFLYCALYPEDYEIHVCNLIDKWIWEGFLGKVTTTNIQDMRDLGEHVLEKLKHSCLLESVEDALFLDRTIKMHDMIRDMALWLARDLDKNKNKILVLTESSRLASKDYVETYEVVERVSSTEHGKLFVPARSCPNLTTLMFRTKDQYDDREPVHLSNADYMSKLKVMDLSCDESGTILLKLPTEIGGLVHLKYLSLEGVIMYRSEFPMELKNLRKLKYFSLKVIGGDLASIPLEVIENLEQLRVLKFLGWAEPSSGEEKEFLEKLESLQHLEELEILLRSQDGVMKLLESTKLQTCVKAFRNKSDTSIDVPLLLASLSKMKKLQRIEFVFMSFIEDCHVFDMCCLSKLREVALYCCNTINHLTWLKYAPSLQFLQICFCSSLEEVIKGGVEDEKGRESVDIFSSLVELKLACLPELKSIHNTPLCFASSLIHIQISGCPKLKKLPFDSNTVIHKLREIEGDPEWWDNLEWEDPTIKHKCEPLFFSDWFSWNSEFASDG